MQPSVTIVTPSYNQAQYLEATMRSVLEQDYPALEYFVIDGASSDGSQAIIEKYASRLAWWVSERDRGQAEAINKGLQRASGQYVAWLNSDDLYLPGAIRTAVESLERNPHLGMVFGDAISIDAAGRPTHWQTFGKWGLEEFIRFRIICQPAVVMRRSVLEQAGYLEADYHYMLDHHLWIRMLCHAPAGYIGAGAGKTAVRPLAAARYHPAAKNVALPRAFALETGRLMAWMEAQPDLASLIERSRSQVQGGRYRLQARYLLDGGEAGAALGAYGRAFVAWPQYTLRHWRRILYATLCLVHLNRPLDVLRQKRTGEQSAHGSPLVQRLQAAFGPEIGDWPGLEL